MERPFGRAPMPRAIREATDRSVIAQDSRCRHPGPGAASATEVPVEVLLLDLDRLPVRCADLALASGCVDKRSLDASVLSLLDPGVRTLALDQSHLGERRRPLGVVPVVLQ